MSNVIKTKRGKLMVECRIKTKSEERNDDLAADSGTGAGRVSNKTGNEYQVVRTATAEICGKRWKLLELLGVEKGRIECD